MDNKVGTYGILGVSPIYARFPLISQELIVWCSKHIDMYYDPATYNYHATVVYSKTPVDCSKIPIVSDNVRIPSGGAGRELRFFGNTLVLALGKEESEQIIKIHNMFKDFGASWDYPEYIPHITLSTESRLTEDEILSIKPFRGPLAFGPLLVKQIVDNRNEAIERHLFGKYTSPNGR